MKIIFDFSELHLNINNHPRLDKTGRAFGVYQEIYGLPSITLDMDYLSKTEAPPHVLPGVVDELIPASVLAHELCHFALQYGEANKKAKLSRKQEERVCDAVATVFSHLFFNELNKLIHQANHRSKKDVRIRRRPKKKN